SLEIPPNPARQAIVEATPSNHLTFLTTQAGKPFSPAGFTNWFRDMCNEAGLPRGTSAHGLRKAACRRLAEAGCSANLIAAVSGHRSLREVQRYTLALDQARMARSAMEKVTRTSSVNLATRFDNSAPNPLVLQDAESSMVPLAGLEPARCCHHLILSQARLPIPPQG